MNLVKTSFYTSLSTAITFVSGFIVTKVVAVKIGPSGIAYVGQFQNAIAILTMLATGAISSGVVKYLASYQGDPEKQNLVVNTALKITLICSFLIATGVIITSRYLSRSAFHMDDFWFVFVLYGLFLTLISLNSFFASYFNGLKQIRKLTIVNVTSSVVGIGFTILLASLLNVKGVLIASNFTALVVFLLNLWLLRGTKEITWKLNFREWDKKMLRMLFAFTLITLASGFLTPFTQMTIRSKILTGFSADEAGYWQAVTRISDYYLAFVTTVLGVYYLPRLSEIKDKTELKTEIANGYKIILPVVAAMALTIWFCRELIVHILFTPKFLPMLPLFKYQLLGDFFKIGSWLLGFLMIARAMTKTFIITELLFSISIIILSYICIGHYGIIGATYAFCINYALYWIVIFILMRKHIF